MVDLFQIGDLLRFYRAQYPAMIIKTSYNPHGFYMNVWLRNNGHRAKYTFTCTNTAEAENGINMSVIEYLAKWGYEDHE